MESRLTSTLSRGEIAQGGRHQPHQAVEDDFQHRQAFIGHQRRIDDGADAGLVLHLVGIDVEAQKGVDFVLVQNAFGGAAGIGRRASSGARLRRRGGFVGRRVSSVSSAMVLPIAY